MYSVVAKNPKGLAEKMNSEGRPPETISDYGAAQVSVDSPAARGAVVAADKKQFKVLREDAGFDRGDREYSYRNYSLQVKMSNGVSMELQVVPPDAPSGIQIARDFAAERREEISCSPSVFGACSVLIFENRSCPRLLPEKLGGRPRAAVARNEPPDGSRKGNIGEVTSTSCGRGQIEPCLSALETLAHSAV